MNINENPHDILYLFSLTYREYAHVILQHISEECNKYAVSSLLIDINDRAFFNPYVQISPTDIKAVLLELSKNGLITISEEISDKKTGTYAGSLIKVSDIELLRKCIHVLTHPGKYAVDKLNVTLDKNNYTVGSNPYMSDGVFNKSGISLDLDNARLSFMEMPPIDISPRSNAIKLLRILMINDMYITYSKIAKELDINALDESTREEDIYKDVSRAIGDIRKQLVKLLVTAGMTNPQINTILVTKRKYGYILKP